MSNVKFSQLPNLGNITANTIVPVVSANTNYTVTAANLQSYVNSSTGNVTSGNLNSPTLNNSGNISVVAGGNTWTFGSTGNLTLPANTFSVNYANGNAVTFSGGSGNTGNVTFNDQAVVGTGDQVGSSGLYQIG
jgi:archaellum component FlaF (FlaF/FlaG flagellin family)